MNRITKPFEGVDFFRLKLSYIPTLPSSVAIIYSLASSMPFVYHQKLVSVVEQHGIALENNVCFKLILRQNCSCLFLYNLLKAFYSFGREFFIATEREGEIFHVFDAVTTKRGKVGRYGSFKRKKSTPSNGFALRFIDV